MNTFLINCFCWKQQKESETILWSHKCNYKLFVLNPNIVNWIFNKIAATVWFYIWAFLALGPKCICSIKKTEFFVSTTSVPEVKKCCTELIWLLGHLVMTSDRREWWRGAGGRQGCWCWRTRRTWSLSSPSSSSPPPGEACRGRFQKSVEFSQENLVGSIQVRKIPHFFDFFLTLP